MFTIHHLASHSCTFSFLLNAGSQILTLKFLDHFFYLNHDSALIFLIQLINCFQYNQFNKAKIVAQTFTISSSHNPITPQITVQTIHHSPLSIFNSPLSIISSSSPNSVFTSADSIPFSFR
jgi:hypothetical protein